MILSHLLFSLLVVVQEAQDLPNFPQKGVCRSNDQWFRYHECANNGCSLDACRESCKKITSGFFSFYKAGDTHPDSPHSAARNICLCKTSCDIIDRDSALPYTSYRIGSPTGSQPAKPTPATPPVTGRPIVTRSTPNTVCPSGTDLQTKEECQAFNGPGAGTWFGDLSSRPAHVALFPRGCWVWGNVNRHWIQPDGVIRKEANSKPICFATPGRSVTRSPTVEPTPSPTAEPTPSPTAEPTLRPTAEPTPSPTANPSQRPATRHLVAMSFTNMVCPTGTDVQTMEECQAFNGPGAGTWQGDLSGSVGHKAAHPRGCWVWGDANRHWIQPDGVIRTEAHSKPICYGTSVTSIGRRLLSTMLTWSPEEN